MQMPQLSYAASENLWGLVGHNHPSQVNLAAGSFSAAAQAEAFLLLSQLSTPAETSVTDSQGTEATGRAAVSSGAQSPASRSSLPGTEEFLQRATSVALQHSASAAHAWRLYGDWLYSQHDMAGAEISGSSTATSAMRVKAANAYCQAVSHAAGSASAGDTMSALLRILQVSAQLRPSKPKQGAALLYIVLSRLL